MVGLSEFHQHLGTAVRSVPSSNHRGDSSGLACDGSNPLARRVACPALAPPFSQRRFRTSKIATCKKVQDVTLKVKCKPRAQVQEGPLALDVFSNSDVDRSPHKSQKRSLSLSRKHRKGRGDAPASLSSLSSGPAARQLAELEGVAFSTVRFDQRGEDGFSSGSESLRRGGGGKRSHGQFVEWFREGWPYIQGHRGSTVVIVIPGEIIGKKDILDNILLDVALLHGLGVKIVLVTGVHQQIDELLRERGEQPAFVGAYRITGAGALDAAMEAAGRVRVGIEAKLSRGLAIPALRRHGENDRWHEVGLPVASGNYVAAKRRGVVDGVDYGYTGEVRKVDVARIQERLNSGCVVLLSNLGFSSMGEVLNCNAYEVATACAVSLHVDKLLCLLDGPVLDDRGRLIPYISLDEADVLIRERAGLSQSAAAYVRSLGIYGPSPKPKNGQANGKKTERPSGLAIGGQDFVDRSFLEDSHAYLAELAAAVYACRGGVRRVHLLDGTVEGALLLELYTRDGVGTMVSSDMYEGTREARPNDIPGIQKLLAPLEEAGVLVKRSKDQLLRELASFHVVERDGMLIACAALIVYPRERTAEVAAFVVSPECRGQGRGDTLLDYLEQKAQRLGLDSLFLLTTRTADWFLQRGFASSDKERIPVDKQKKIDPTRGSKCFMKDLWPSAA